MFLKIAAQAFGAENFLKIFLMFLDLKPIFL